MTSGNDLETGFGDSLNHCGSLDASLVVADDGFARIERNFDVFHPGEGRQDGADAADAPAAVHAADTECDFSHQDVLC
jgi:hypothetical protein